MGIPDQLKNPLLAAITFRQPRSPSRSRIPAPAPTGRNTSTKGEALEMNKEARSPQRGEIPQPRAKPWKPLKNAPAPTGRNTSAQPHARMGWVFGWMKQLAL